MNYVIVDLEATCQRDKNKPFDMEIIEIGAVKVNSDGVIIGRFDSFVRPVINPVLSSFCKDLTTITQEDVDGAKEFPVVLEEFLAWCALGDNDFTVCSWGFYDKKQFIKDCKYHGMTTDWLEGHISIKHQHGAKIVHVRNTSEKGGGGWGLAKALKYEGLQFDGTPHRGVDDAFNIAKIFIKHFDVWDFE